jgi:hypothetical protein
LRYTLLSLQVLLIPLRMEQVQVRMKQIQVRMKQRVHSCVLCLRILIYIQ